MSKDQTSKISTIRQTARNAGKAVIYLRVANIDRVKCDDEHFAIPAQRKACRKKAEQLGLTIVDEYADAGKSGNDVTNRYGLRAMLDRIDRGDVSHVIIYDLDRLTRNSLEAIQLLLSFQRAGVEPVYAARSIRSTPEGQMIHGIVSIMSQFLQSDDGAMEDPSQDEVPDEY